MKTTIKWDADYYGVMITTDTGLSFVVSGQPSMGMSWHDAVRFYKNNKMWKLPTCQHLQLIAEHIDDINACIEANGGYKIYGWHWTTDEIDEFCAWIVGIRYGYAYSVSKRSNYYVRAVSAFQI